MQARTHILTGMALATAIYGIMHEGPVIDIYNLGKIPLMTYATIGAAAIGAIAPDLDIPESMASGHMAPINKRIAEMIVNALLITLTVLAIINSKNKVILYSGIALIAYIAVNYSSITSRLFHYLRLFMQYGLIAVIFYMYFKTMQTPYLFISITLFIYVVSKHRGISHTPILNLWAALVVYYTLKYYGYERFAVPVAGYYLLGAAAHIFANDLFTNRGIPNPLHPLTIPINFVRYAIKNRGISLHVFLQSIRCNRIHLPLTFETGGPIEEIVSTLMIVCMILSARYL